MKETIENLTKAFIGESQARNRYTFYAKVAQKEGFEQIADVFLLTADNEREHAKWLFRLIGSDACSRRLSRKRSKLRSSSCRPATSGLERWLSRSR